MDDDPNPALQTETVSFCPLKFQRAEALDLIQRLSHAFEVRIDRIEETPKRLSIDMLVTVTGDPARIAEFARAATGHEKPDRDPADGLFDVAWGVLRAGADWATRDFNW